MCKLVAKPNSMFISLLIALLFKPSPQISDYNDSLIFTNHIFNENIKSVQLYNEEWNLSYPIIKLRSNDKLILHFDLLGSKIETYYYTFIHCDKDWKKSNIYPNDFMEGFPENPIENYNSSFNTTVNYIHYKISFPGDRVQFKLSGNYILLVYPLNEPDNPVLSQRFIITENAVKINITPHRSRMTSEIYTVQQVDFTVDFSAVKLADPYKDVFAFILQNGRWNNAKKNLKPEFISSKN
jgi:hypothetical protein